MSNLKRSLITDIQANIEKLKCTLKDCIRYNLDYDCDLVKITISEYEIQVVGKSENFRKCEIRFNNDYSYTNKGYKQYLDISTLQVRLRKDDKYFEEYMEVLRVQNMLLEKINLIEHIFVSSFEVIQPLRDELSEIRYNEEKVLKAQKEQIENEYLETLLPLLKEGAAITANGTYNDDDVYLIDKITEKSIMVYEINYAYEHNSTVRKSYHRTRLNKKEVLNNLKSNHYSISSPCLVEIV